MQSQESERERERSARGKCLFRREDSDKNTTVALTHTTITIVDVEVGVKGKQNTCRRLERQRWREEERGGEEGRCGCRVTVPKGRAVGDSLFSVSNFHLLRAEIEQTWTRLEHMKLQQRLHVRWHRRHWGGTNLH